MKRKEVCMENILKLIVTEEFAPRKNSYLLTISLHFILILK